MPVVLVLFAVALVITLVGIFLSPKSRSRRLQDEYTVVPREKSVIVRTTPAPARARARWADIAESEVAPLKVRASRTQAQIQAVRPQVVRPRIAKSAAAVRAVDIGFGERLSSWKVFVPALATVFLLSFYLLNTTLPHPLLWSPVFFGSANQPTTPVAPTAAPVYTATQHLLRLGQLDPNQYNSTQEYDTWSYSACSSASMTEVINSYGHNYRITDILTVESRIHAITPQDGLLSESGIQLTGAQFGFKTTWGHNLSLDQVIAAASHGTPVIVSFPPYRYPGGHILVVRGGNASVVYLADSSRLNMTQLTRTRFLQLWAGFYAIMTPA